MRYYIIAGEASGDLHGSNLIKEIRKLDSDSTIRCWGGDLMKEAGAQLVKHYRDLAFMGFIEVVKNLGTIIRNLRFCKDDIIRFKPDAVILVDYPGFNLRIAEWAAARAINTIYYISPQVWAWKESRVKKIKESVNKMIVILPFEKDFYKKWNYEVDYVGHPLVQVIENAETEAQLMPASFSPLNKEKIIALLPGSREQEVTRKLPIMLAVSRFFPDYQFTIAKAASLSDAYYEQFMRDYPGVRGIRNKTYELLMQSKAALVTSGTATLETALLGVPEVVVYKGNNISYQIAKRLVKIKYISLVNLIMDKVVVKELIQHDLTVENLRSELKKILFDEHTIRQLKIDYANLKQLLKEGGHASEKAARIIVNFLRC